MDEEGLYSLAQQEIMDQITSRIKGVRVLDAFCGVGGSAIGFARAGRQVLTVDINASRLEMAKFNAELFSVAESIEFRRADILTVLDSEKADTVFLDPPWGGPSYSNQKEFLLEHFFPDGKLLLEKSFAAASEVVIRLPKNFRFEDLASLQKPAHIQKNLFHDKLLHYTAYFSSLSRL